MAEHIILVALTLFFNAFCVNEGAKILFTAAVDSGTHIGSMVPLIKRAAAEGHNVTVFETSSLGKQRDLGPKVNFIFIQVPPESTSAQRLAAAMFVEDIRADGLHFPFEYGNQKLGQFMSNEGDMKKVTFDIISCILVVIHNERYSRLSDLGQLRDPPNAVLSGNLKQVMDEQWDLVILDELFGVHSFGLALYFKRRRNTPYIVYSTTAMIQSTAYSLALGRNLVAEPYLITTIPTSDKDMYSPAKFYDRLNNFYDSTADLFLIKFYEENFRLDNIARMGVPHFTWHELYKKSSLIFADYIDRMKYALTESSDIRVIGSTCGHSKPLAQELEEFVSDPQSNGTIYIAFGSNVNWKWAPATLLDAFFEAINRFEHHRVIFSYNGEPRRGVKPHVKLIRWAPQFDVLTHYKTKLFISHGGLKSFKETICAKLPFVHYYFPMIWMTRGQNHMGTKHDHMGTKHDHMGTKRNANYHILRHYILRKFPYIFAGTVGRTFKPPRCLCLYLGELLCLAPKVVYMPVFAEQTYNAKLALRMGYASVVNKFNLNADQLANAISKTLYSDSYKANAEKAYSFYLDRPVASLDQAMFDIERVLKRPARPVHYLRKGIDLSWLAMFYIDWIGLFLVFMSLILQ